MYVYEGVIFVKENFSLLEMLIRLTLIILAIEAVLYTKMFPFLLLVNITKFGRPSKLCHLEKGRKN